MADYPRGRSGDETTPYTEEIVSGALDLVRNTVERCERDYHDRWVEKCEARYRAYRGLLEVEPDPDDWRSHVTAPYVLQTCEGMIATMLEPEPSFDVRPRPRPFDTLEEVMERSQRSDSLEDLLSYAMDRSDFPQQQRPFMQQDLICGLSVFKDYWLTKEIEEPVLTSSQVEIHTDSGVTIESLPGYDEIEETVTVYDDPTCLVRDVRDFFWPMQATSAEKAEYLIDRSWESYEELERQAEDGIYSKAEVKKLKSSRDVAAMKGVSDREMRLRGVDRTKSLVEVLEYWTPTRVITVANRYCVLRDEPNPFRYGRRPFVVCSALPDAFQIPGISVVEALAQLQEMLWTLQNSRLDAVRLMVNMITLIRSDVDNADEFEWAPEAQWYVEDPGQVSTLGIDPNVANITLQAEALLKGDLQNIMGGLPMAGGVDSNTIDQQTATGVSIITSIAQRLIQARKQHYLWSFAQLAKDYLLLYQQFMREERVIRVVGRQGLEAFKRLDPLAVQGDFDVTINVTGESMMRQERRAEAQSAMQVAASIAPIMAQSGAPLNLRAFMDRVLDSFDIRDKERFYMTSPGIPGQAGAPPPGTPPAPQAAEANGGAPPQGITNPELAAGPTSPSNAASMSPEAAMQRLMSMYGGAANAPTP